MIEFKCDVQSSIKMFGGGAGSGGSSTTSGPWSGQQPYLSDVMSDAQNQYQNYTPQYYGADGSSLNGQDISGQSTITPFNSQETSAISQLGDLGANGTSATNAANGALTNYANGNMINAANNPGLQNVEQQAAASVTPGLMSSFTQGTTDNPNVALAASNGVANAVGNIAYNNYNTQTGNQITAANDASNLYNTQIAGANAGLTAGQAQQTQDQSQLQNNVNMFNYDQQLPYQQINQYSNLVNGQYGASSTTTSPAQGLFSVLFSDRRMKENIEKVGRANNGLAIYRYNYKGSDVTHLGFMADEVRQVNPQAVHVHESGFDMVDYKEATK